MSNQDYSVILEAIEKDECVGECQSANFLSGHLTTLIKDIEDKQATIDRIMFEYCPDDMTAEQIHRYGLAQHKVDYLDIPVFLRRGCDKQ